MALMRNIRRSPRFVQTLPNPPPHEQIIELSGDVCEHGYGLIKTALQEGVISIADLGAWFRLECTRLKHTQFCRKAFSRPIPLSCDAIANILRGVKLRNAGWKTELGILVQTVGPAAAQWSSPPSHRPRSSLSGSTPRRRRIAREDWAGSNRSENG